MNIGFSPSIVIGRAANCFFIFFPEKAEDQNKMLAKAMGDGMREAMKAQNRDEVLEELRQNAPELMEKIMKENPRILLFQTWEQVTVFFNELKAPKIKCDSDLPFLPDMELFPGE